MSTETTQTLLTQWKQNQLHVERAIGQLLQHVARLDEENEAAKVSRTQLAQTLRELATALKKVQADVDRLMTHTGLERPKRGRPRTGQSTN